VNEEREDNEDQITPSELNDVTVHAFGFDLDPDSWIDRVRQAFGTTQPELFVTPPWEDRDSDEPGQRVGAYELVVKIGEGGMGTVWRARRVDHQFEREVAIKLIRTGARSRDGMRRFQLEGQVLASLAHPNIARLFDGGTMPDGRPYLVMEYVAGVSIVDYCRMRRLTVDERIALFELVCDAVHSAHRNLVLHRDLKPSNILVTRDGAPKLLDFGIAKLIDDSAADRTAITETDVRVLTPRYASPEQIRGAKLTTATDVYSLGVVLYELLTGLNAYDVDSASRVDMERAVLDQEPTRASIAVGQRCDLGAAERRGLSRRLRGALDTILARALQKNAEDRYQFAQELANDLQRHLAGKSIVAAPDSTAALFGKFVRRNKALAVAAAVSIATLVGATAVSLWYAASESRACAEAERRTRIAQSINAFIDEDLLSSADPRNTDNPNLTVREALDRAAERIGERFHDQPLVEAAIRHTIGETYRGLELPKASVPHLRRAVELREAALGRLDVETRQAMRDLVAGLYESDLMKEGYALGNELLALDIEAAGSDSADAMDTRHLIARYGNGDANGEIDIATLQSVLEWNRLERGEAHPETLSVMHTLANDYLYLGRTDEATPLIEEIWETTRANYGSSSPETLDAMLGLAVLYGRTDRAEEAVALLQEAVGILRETRPRNFADTGIWLTHLGIHLGLLERFDEAEAAYIEAFEILSASLGPENGWAQGPAGFLAELYEKRGEMDKAAEWRARLVPQKPASPSP